MTTEQEEVEIHRPRSPAWTWAPPEGSLQLLEGHQERQGAAGGIMPRWHVEGGDGVEEGRLVDHPHRPRPIEARDPTQPDPREGGEGLQGRHQPLLHRADVAPQSNVGADAGPPRDWHLVLRDWA
jgi:hypothetical protein